MKIDLPTLSRAMSSIATFLVWTLTSFLCHCLGKTFLSLSQDSGYWFGSQQVPGILGHFFRAFVLTTIQLALCAIYIQPAKVGVNSKQVKVAMVSHALATLATNLSMALMVASSTFAIKLLEPITSAFLQYLMLGTAMTLMTKVSLPIIVSGAIMFTGNPFNVSGTTYGFLAALASNFILALRNISIKQMQSSAHQTTKQRLSLNKERLMPGFLLTLLVLVGLRCLENMYGKEIEGITYIAMAGVTSAIFHVTYSYTSTGLVLEKVSVVSHAVANITKRVVVVILLYCFGQRVASPYQWLGFLVCVLGLAIYVWGKSHKTTESYQAEFPDKGPETKPSLSWQALLRKSLICGVPLCLILVIMAKSFGRPETYKPLITSYVSHQLTIYNNDSASTYSAYAPNNVQWRDSFGVNGFKHPTDEELLPDLSSIENMLPEKVQVFLNKRLAEDVTEANLISKELSTSFEIIKEAQRLHFNIITDILKGFKYAVLFDIAAHENKGDPCITIGEIYYLKRIGVEIIYYCNALSCTHENIRNASRLAKKYSPKDLVIMLHGGGNIILYPSRDIVKFKVFPFFTEFSIVIFPQSVSVHDPNWNHVKTCRKMYCCNPNLTIITRDRLSFDISKELFNGSTKVMMAPDMAFQIGHVPRTISPVFDILWIKREDKESVGYTVKQDFRGYKVHISDWKAWRTPEASNSLEKAFYAGTNGFFYLQRGRVVITDRLHGHILSTLMDIPHVIIDNEAFKVSRYHNTWTKGLENTLMTDDYTRALDLAIGLLKKYNDTLPPTVPYLTVSEDHTRSTFGLPGHYYP